jgi:hypothetical protein
MDVRRLAALASILALTLAAAPPRITVNDAPLNVAPIAQDGRVLVPMRAIFEALGATLTYDAHAHTIAAQGNGHSVRLQIGNENAVVDDRIVMLDVPARVIAATTYVPLRFVAQALGAVVGYDNAAALVTVSLAQTTASAGSGRVGSMLPAPDSSVATGYPTISAVVAGSAAVTSANLTVDGVDVTDSASFNGTTMTYIPQQGLQPGTHDVAFSGTDSANQPFDGTWSFTTTTAAETSDSSAPQFYLDGDVSEYGYGDDMDFVLIGPPGGTAYFTTCDSPVRTWMTGVGNTYRARIRAPYGFGNGSCPIEAVYIGGGGYIWYSPFPVFAHLRPRGGHRPGPYHRPTPRPTSHPTSRPTRPPVTGTPEPPRTRPPHRPLETPHPIPQSTTAPAPIHTTVPAPTQTFAPRPFPTLAPRPRPTFVPRPIATQAPPRPRPPHHTPVPKPPPPAPKPQQTNAP